MHQSVEVKKKLQLYNTVNASGILTMVNKQKEHNMHTKLAIKHEKEQDHLEDLPLDGMIILNSGKRLCLVISVMCYST
jgi:hypothetical protein